MTTPLTTRIGAYGLILREQQILLCRISERIEQSAGFWTLPGGGLESDEDPEDAMVREVREETGLDVRSKGVAGMDLLELPTGSATTHSLRVVYFTEVVDGTLEHEVDGSTDLCEWHDLDAVAMLPVVELVETALTFL